jgi:hypothetical protein
MVDFFAFGSLVRPYYEQAGLKVKRPIAWRSVRRRMAHRCAAGERRRGDGVLTGRF